MRKIAADSIQKSKLKNKELYDKKIKPANYKIGDLVFVQKETKINKLDKNYTGPHKIVDILDLNNVIIERDGKRKLKHIDKIKHAHIRP